MKTLATLLLAVTTLTASSQTPMAAAKAPLSPPKEASVTLGAKSITIHYNSPSMRGRKIMGELVPFGKVWRTGANPATSFVTTADLKVGSITVPAGSYTIYTIPAEAPSSWILILNKQTGQWGTEYKQEMDLGRTEMKLSKLSAPQESMTISFEKTKSNSTELHVKWETTDAWVEIKTEK